MKRCRPILLLELLISLIIMGVVLEMLFVGYSQFMRAKEELLAEKERVLKEHRLLRRLQLLFGSAQSFKEIPEKGFFLTYQGAIDQDRDFRGPLEGYLYVDHNRLTLISWAEKTKSRIEVLYEPVTKIQFSFFNPKSGAFEFSFPPAKPLMMKATLTFKENDLIIPLFL